MRAEQQSEPERPSPGYSVLKAAPILRSIVTAIALVAGLALSGAIAQAPVIDMRDLRPGDLRSDAFVLDRREELRVEAVGAAPGSESGNWLTRNLSGPNASSGDQRSAWQGNAWILDARSRTVLWELREADARRGRGDLRKFDGALSLPAGVYEVYYAAYPRGWEPGSTGSWDDNGRRARELTREFYLTISGERVRRASRDDRTRAREEFDREAVVSLRRLGPSSSQHVGFKVDRRTEVEVYAIGEAQRDGASDYGWIVNTDTQQRVWQMKYAFSERAGGADKNRLDRRMVTLRPGRYAAFYTTDDSHDPTEWNSAPPYDPDYYGLTIRVLNAKDRARIQILANSETDRAGPATTDEPRPRTTDEPRPRPTYEPPPRTTDEARPRTSDEPQATSTDETRPAGAVASILRVGDDAHERAPFTLDRDTDLRVHAVGEGSGGQMYDYAWIQDARSGDIVWEMRYRATSHAGGADKNRQVNETVRLPAGEYILHYRSDGSHSYNDWNADPPDDPDAWGVVLYRVIR